MFVSFKRLKVPYKGIYIYIYVYPLNYIYIYIYITCISAQLIQCPFNPYNAIDISQICFNAHETTVPTRGWL